MRLKRYSPATLSSTVARLSVQHRCPAPSSPAPGLVHNGRDHKTIAKVAFSLYLPASIGASASGLLNELGIPQIVARVSETAELYSASLGLLDPIYLYTTAFATLFVAVAIMSRYTGSWGYFPHRHPTYSPYPAIVADPMDITDDDFQYITSEDIINHNPSQGMPQTVTGRRRVVGGRPRPRSVTPPPEDDVLIIKNKGITYPAHFEAYTIYDGEVLVRHVQDKIGEMMELSPEATRDVKLLYKGSNMSDPELPVKSYGVKNNSEILAVVREWPRHRRRDRDVRDVREDASVISSGSSEDVVVAADGEANPLRRKRSRKFKRRHSRHGHRDNLVSNPSLPNHIADHKDEREEPQDRMDDSREDMSSTSRPQISPLPPLPTTAPMVPGGPMNKLSNILSSFETELVPRCNEFMANPPSDPKKLTDEHTKLTETIFQRVLLKLDEVETGGNDDARTRRRQIVKHTQNVLKMLDDIKAAQLASGV